MVWQGKRRLEYGSGMGRLRQVISEKVLDEGLRVDFRPVRFINKEHLCYYKIYRARVGDIPKPRDGEKTFPICGAGMNMDGFNCKICGHVLNMIAEDGEHSRTHGIGSRWPRLQTDALGIPIIQRNTSSYLRAEVQKKAEEVVERLFLTEIFSRTMGNVSEAARQAKMNRSWSSQLSM